MPPLSSRAQANGSIDQCTNPWRARIPAALTHTATIVGLFVNCFIDSIGSVG
ncbi:MAG TPA: hypothetical protein VH539_00975 [Gemmatimonadaceae bacterium]